jgi:hypothetical protein
MVELIAALNRWKQSAIWLLAISAVLQLFGGFLGRDFYGIIVSLVVAGIAILGIWFLKRDNWAAGSTILAIVGIAHSIILIGIVEIVISLRMWAAAERLWISSSKRSSN